MFIIKSEELLKQPYVIKKKFVNQINKEQKSWVAQAYPELGKMSYGDVLKRSGYGNGPITRYCNILKRRDAKYNKINLGF